MEFLPHIYKNIVYFHKICDRIYSIRVEREKNIGEIDTVEYTGFECIFCYRRNLYMEKSTLIIFDCRTGDFVYPEIEGSQKSVVSETRPLWQILKEDGWSSEDVAERIQEKINSIVAADKPQAEVVECVIKDKNYQVGFVCPVPGELLSITFNELDNEAVECHQPHVSSYDELTGLMERNSFFKVVKNILNSEKESVKAGEYALVYLDVLRFKAINDMFGMEQGDGLLRYIADTIRKCTEENVAACRLTADRFVFFVHSSGKDLEERVEHILEEISKYDLPVQIICNIGIYQTNEEELEIDPMIDRAILAQASIKGSYTSKYKYYTESLRKEMLGEQEISGLMITALEQKQFVIYYQPQYNHSTGKLVGAEALVRWIHPERGLISPGVFIPIFEKNGFITKLDLYVFEEVCCFIRGCIDKGISIVPISSNFSRYDVFQPDFVEKLEEIRSKYNVPTKYLRIEITESVVVGGSQYVNGIVRKLHEYGYVVEMDDFGSGYSSLNVLKDVELDIIKLDMLFLSEESDSKRGGTILSSMVRMAKWLGMPVIAEGVEHVEQADFLRSIGCDYIQGYLYSRPLPEEQYLELINKSDIGAKVPQFDLIATLNSFNFWDPKSQETLIFSNYVGGASIFEYYDGRLELLRVNQKYLKELSMDLSEKDLIEGDPMRFFDDTNKQIYFDALERAIETGDEQECETWRDNYTTSRTDDKICLRSNIRMIGKGEDGYLFYGMIRNITAEKKHYSEMIENERRFRIACDQVNMYYWEYNIETHEMRPCFRCIRDFDVLEVVTNYPDSSIEMGIFPPEVADMYRDWHRQLAEGVEKLEAVIPLTEERIPYRVRYTTEFDKDGKPVKAYGSAVLETEDTGK